MKPGHAGTGTRGRRRNGTACLTAAPGAATGKAAVRTAGRSRPEGFPAFPGRAAGGIAPGTPVHAIPGRVPPHGSAEAREWLEGRPDRTFRFTPAPASWMNAAGGFFPKLPGQRPENAVSGPPAGRVAATGGCIEHRSAGAARPFRWSGKPEDLVEACRKGRRKLQGMDFND